MAVSRPKRSLARRAVAFVKKLIHKNPAPDLSLPVPTATQAASRPDKKTILKHPAKKDFLKQVVPEAVGDCPLPSFDPGIFHSELLDLKLYPEVDPNDPKNIKEPEGNVREGTYLGTQLALTQAYERVEQRFNSLFDVLGIEPTFPRYVSLEQQRNIYQFTPYPNNADGTPAEFPPHLQHIPVNQNYTVFGVFNTAGLLETAVILQKLIPDEDGFLGRTKQWLLEKARAAAYGGEPEKGITIQDVDDYNRFHRKIGTDIASGGNIGLLDDWYSDRRFAEQQFTGTNPTTITQAGKQWIGEFLTAARIGGYNEWISALEAADPASLFVQDGSYFRNAVGVSDHTAVLHHKQPGSDDNWSVGAVSLFQLHDDGKLHPVAICIDYRGSVEQSVTIFNKRLTPNASTRTEKTDWPWRYAKTCAQVTDWMRHELTVHLTLAHLVEEAIIVGTNRSLPMEHPVYRLLSPHWYKTLSVNAAARATLVPQVIVDIVGISPEQCHSFIRHAYDTYEFVGNYVPNDLARRGFPNTASGLSSSTKYRNYAYAKDVLALWTVLRSYVSEMLALSYPSDESVAQDQYIQSWCAEMRQGGAHMSSFPEIRDLYSLTDAVTMCIHTATSFHSAVNYLQNFYQAFVIAKPPMLCTAPPTSLSELQQMKEHDLVASLPINRQRQWLLSAQVPWLLSFRAPQDRSLLNYAASMWRVHKTKQGRREKMVAEASERLYQRLRETQTTVWENSRAMEKGSLPYMVLDPGNTAVSILI
ncbi:lipoxygenase [Sordaria sp. MPI-SDFR-AT-0083]|nr:lipoxygenase [Sordaria sp. MPI-SDFR-AT-0083]